MPHRFNIRRKVRSLGSLSQARVTIFGAWPSARVGRRDEFDTERLFDQALVDRLPVPAEDAFGLTRIAVEVFTRDFRLEHAARHTVQTSRAPFREFHDILGDCDHEPALLERLKRYPDSRESPRPIRADGELHTAARKESNRRIGEAIRLRPSC
jgi:hypothetical protein